MVLCRIWPSWSNLPDWCNTTLLATVTTRNHRIRLTSRLIPQIPQSPQSQKESISLCTWKHEKVALNLSTRSSQRDSLAVEREASLDLQDQEAKSGMRARGSGLEEDAGKGRLGASILRVFFCHFYSYCN